MEEIYEAKNNTKRNFSIRTGLHKGEKIELTLKPNGDDSKTGRGIIFKRVDVTDKDNIIKVDYKNLFDLERGTNIKNEADVRVHTIEHFMSSLSVSGITDIIVEINGNELPILDGSSIQFMKKLEEAGIKELESEIEPVVITEPVIFTQERMENMFWHCLMMDLKYHIR